MSHINKYLQTTMNMKIIITLVSKGSNADKVITIVKV